MAGKAHLPVLCAAACAVALLTSRITLLLHEFVGHAGVAVLAGGRVTDWWLFLFAGGRIEYDLPAVAPATELAIAIGGIALEVAIGTPLLWLGSRLRSPVWRFAVISFAAIDVVHGLTYLARGTHYGFGDGTELHALLGARRWVLVAPAVAALVAAGFLGARTLARSLSDWLPGASPRRLLASLAIAVAVAGAVHGALAFGELALFPDPAYARLMEDRAVADARRELEEQLRGQPPPDPERARQMLEQLLARRRPFPLDPLLFGGLGLALLTGAWRGARDGRPSGAPAPEWRAVAALASALGVMVLAIALFRAP